MIISVIVSAVTITIIVLYMSFLAPFFVKVQIKFLQNSKSVLHLYSTNQSDDQGTSIDYLIKIDIYGRVQSAINMEEDRTGKFPWECVSERECHG